MYVQRPEPQTKYYAAEMHISGPWAARYKVGFAASF